MKSKLLKRISFSIAVVLLASFCLTGCSVNDSLSSADELEFLLIHSTDKVYKIYYSASCNYFFGELYKGTLTLDSLNEKLPLDPHLKKDDPEFMNIPCEGHGYVIKHGDYIENVFGTCFLKKNYVPHVLKYVEEPNLVFDSSVEIKEVYILIPANPYENEEYIYYVTDNGNYIFIKTSKSNETVYYLVPADEYGKHCAEAFETEIPEEGLIGGYNFIGTFENNESYRHTEPYKPE
jgi:hypothetical protein